MMEATNRGGEVASRWQRAPGSAATGPREERGSAFPHPQARWALQVSLQGESRSSWAVLQDGDGDVGPAFWGTTPPPRPSPMWLPAHG